MTRVLIIAAGDGTRWNNYLGIPKHLAQIDGEPISHRTVRLFKERGILDIHTVGLDDDRWHIPGAKLYVAKKTADYHGADKFLSSQELWNTEGRTITVFGDVFFSDQAIDLIVNDTDQNWKVYGRPTGSTITGKRYGELFAQSFYPEHLTRHKEKLFYIIDLFNNGVINRCIGWEHYRAMEGVEGNNVSIHKIYRNFSIINDWTDDFDCAEDYTTFIKRRQDDQTLELKLNNS
jgi:hypothetical protein